MTVSEPKMARGKTLAISQFVGGEGGIRTHGALADTAVFKTADFNHSPTSPHDNEGEAIPPLELERKTGFEPATLALARRCSTPELLPHMSAPKRTYTLNRRRDACQLPRRSKSP